MEDDETLKKGLLNELKAGLLKEMSQQIFSVGMSIDVYVRRRIFEWPDIRKCYRVRIS